MDYTIESRKITYKDGNIERTVETTKGDGTKYNTYLDKLFSSANNMLGEVSQMFNLIEDDVNKQIEEAVVAKEPEEVDKNVENNSGYISW